MKFSLLTAVTLSVVCLFTTYAEAQDAAPSPVAPAGAESEAKISDSHHTAALELLDSMNMEATTGQMVDQMLEMQIQQAPQMSAFKDVLKDFLHKHLSFKAIKGDMAKLYAKEFTESELKELKDFYQTPIGKKAIEKLPVLSAAGAQIGMKRVQDNMGELSQAILKRQTELQGKP